MITRLGSDCKLYDFYNQSYFPRLQRRHSVHNIQNTKTFSFSFDLFYNGLINFCNRVSYPMLNTIYTNGGTKQRQSAVWTLDYI